MHEVKKRPVIRHFVWYIGYAWRFTYLKWFARHMVSGRGKNEGQREERENREKTERKQREKRAKKTEKGER